MDQLGVILHKTEQFTRCSCVVKQVTPRVLDLVVDVLGEFVHYRERHAHDLAEILQTCLEFHAGVRTNRAHMIDAIAFGHVFLHCIPKCNREIGVHVRHAVLTGNFDFFYF